MRQPTICLISSCPVTGRCTVTKITPRNPYNGIAETLVEVFNQQGELVLTNVTESVIKYRKADEIG